MEKDNKLQILSERTPEENTFLSWAQEEKQSQEEISRGSSVREKKREGCERQRGNIATLSLISEIKGMLQKLHNIK